jgi:WD40 repeat protein
MPDIFISYAREDVAFVRQLHERLTEEGREVWVDWAGIPPSAEWLAEIRTAIDSAASFVFVISPDSVISPVCADELRHAIERSKRIVPLVRREVETGALPETLARLNWIFFRHEDELQASFQQLSKALDTDLDWLRAHTRLLVRAVEWDNQARNASYTLRGRDLRSAESWLTRAQDHEPKLTTLQTEYVLASRKAARRRHAGLTCGAALMVALSFFGYRQMQEGLRQQAIAGAQAALADAQRNLPHQLEASVREAARSLKQFNKVGIRSVEADQILRRGLALLPRLVVEHDPKLRSIAATRFEPTGRFLAIAHGDRHILIWDTVAEQPLDSWSIDPAMESILSVDVSADGVYAATLSYDARRDADATTVIVWQLPERLPRLHERRKGRLEKLRLSPRGTRVYVLGSVSAWGWDVESGAQLAGFPEDQRIEDVAFSPDGQRMAVAFRKEETRDRFVRVSDVATGHEIARWPRQDTALALQWTADPRRILIRTPQRVQLHHALNGRVEASFAQAAAAPALSPDGRLLAELLPDHAVQVRRTADGHELSRLGAHREVRAMAFRPGSLSLVTMSAEPARSVIRVWDLRNQGSTELRHEDAITRIEFSAGGELLFTASAAHQSWWALPARNEPPVALRRALDVEVPSEPGRHRARPSGWPIAAGEKNRVEIVDPHGSSATSMDFPAPVLAAALTRDHRRVAVATGNVGRGHWVLDLEVWDVERRSRLGATSRPGQIRDDYSRFLELTPDDRFIVTQRESGYEVWDAQALAQVATLGHPAPEAIAFEAGGTLAATAGRDRTIRIWEIPSGREIARIENTDPVEHLALSADSRWIAALSAGIVRLWLVQPDELIAQACARLRSPCP